MIFTALSPNTQLDDFLLATKSIYQFWKLNEGEHVEKVEGWFREEFGTSDVFSFETARSALYFLLKAFDIGEGDEVIVQAFTCVAVTNPIKWVGAKSKFADIRQEDFNIDVEDLISKISNKTKSIIVQHTFGYPAEILKIKQIAEERGIIVIEDCAHTIGGKFGNQLLGKIGDAAIFSLGRDKAISGSFGGIALLNNINFRSKLKNVNSDLGYPSKAWTIRKLLYTKIAWLTRTYYDLLSVGKLIHYLAHKFGIIEKATCDCEKDGTGIPQNSLRKLPNGLACVAYNQLGKLNNFNSKRKDDYLFYKNLLSPLDEYIKFPKWNINENFYPLRMPLLVENREELMNYCEKNGVLLGNWYDSILAPKESEPEAFGYREGSCPVSEAITKKIVNLPLHANLSKGNLIHIVNVIKKFYRIKEEHEDKKD